MQAEHRKQLDDFKASVMRNIPDLVEPPDVFPTQPPAPNQNSATPQGDALIASLIRALQAQPATTSNNNNNYSYNSDRTSESYRAKIEKKRESTI